MSIAVEETTQPPRGSTIMNRLSVQKGDGFADDVLEDFYFRLVCDDELLVFFEGVDLAFLKRHQRQFMMFALTEIPDDVDVFQRIPPGHKRLFQMGLSEKHFDMVARHLSETLLCLGIEESLINEVIKNVSPVRAVFKHHAI